MNKYSKQVIYVEVDEELSSIFDRTKNIRKDEIFLVVPRKAILFQSSVNLKILKNKLADKGKQLVIVTTDRNGRHLSQKAGLKVLSRVEVAQSDSKEEPDTPEMKIQPIQARRNEVAREEAPKRVNEKKLSIRELISEYRLKTHKGKRAALEAANRFQFGRPSRKFLLLMMVCSVGLFGIITYIALPNATIYIKPKFDHIDFTVNVTLVDKRKNQSLLAQNKANVIASEVVSTSTKQTKIFNTASKEFKGKNTQGVLTITNTTAEPWSLAENTRFQSDEGIIFRSKRGVEVPPRTLDENSDPVFGKITTPVIADEFDIYGEPVGDRGNLPPSRFTLPGLTKFNQRLIWGESDETMKGGVTDYEKVVKKTDIEAAKKQIEDNLILSAKEDLRTYIDEVNRLNNTDWVLLDDSRYLKTELTDLRLSENLEGSFQEKFEVFAQIEAEGMAFDFDQLYAFLKTELQGRTHPDMRLREDSIAPGNITYEVIDEDEWLGQVKITATIQGIEEFVIDSSTEAGLRFGSRLKNKVVGLDLAEAEKIVANLPEVDKVEIKTWPIWITKFPRVPESIEIKLLES